MGLTEDFSAGESTHYYSNTYSKMAGANSSVGGMSISDGALTDRQKAFKFRNLFPPNHDQRSYLIIELFCNTHKISNISFHSHDSNPETFVVHTGIHLG